MDERAAVRGVVFDWGGVLIEDPAPGLVAYCAEALGVARQELRTASREFLPEFQKGLVGEDDFWARVSSELRIEAPEVGSLWGEAFRSVYEPRDEMFRLVSLLRQRGYGTGLLSNTEAPAVEYFLERGYDMFDVLVFSCVEGTRKPEGRIYEIALEKLELRPEEVVFVDDREEYASAARAVGMNAVLFKSLEQLRRELARLSVEAI